MLPQPDLVRTLADERTRRCRDAMPGRRPTPLRNAAAAVFRHLADFLDPPGVSRAGGALLG